MTTQENFYSTENTPTSSWMKFDNIGDAIRGTFVKKFYKKGERQYPDQIVFVLTNARLEKCLITPKTAESGASVKEVLSSEEIGDINVGIKSSNSYVLNRQKNTMPGDIIGFAFTESIPPSVKGYEPAKSIQTFKAGVDEAFLKTQNGDEENFMEDSPF